MKRRSETSDRPHFDSLINRGPASGMTEHGVPAYVSDSPLTVAGYVETRFVPGHVKHKTDAGRRHYQAILKHILKPETVDRIFAEMSKWQKSRLSGAPDWPYLDEVKLCSVSSEHVRLLIESAAAHGYSPQTIKHIKNVVGAIISHAQNDGIFKGSNPASQIRLQRPVHRIAHNVTMQQAQAIVALLDGVDREMALLSLTTGLSALEICKLQWKHVNLSSSPVRREGQMIPPRCILIYRESASADLSFSNVPRTKTVDIPDALFRRLLRTKRHVRPDGFVLELRRPVPNSGISVSRDRLVRIGRELGIPWLSWQVLKRGHQALLAELRDQLSCSLVASAQ